VLGSSWAAAQCLRKTKFQGKVYMIGPNALREELQKIPGITIIDSSIHNSICVTPREFLNYEVCFKKQF
jgi:ribonucleotide monophosphatase NagD (HAD superfamily)